MLPEGYVGPAWFMFDETVAQDEPPCDDNATKVWVNHWDTDGFAWFENCSVREGEDEYDTHPARPEELAPR